MTKENFWLMKSEPNAYSIDDLKKDDITIWDGIRNYQARNFMRTMNIGDKVFFYHSNCKPPTIVGLMEVIEKDIIDPTQFNSSSNYFDPKSDPSNPKWDCVRVKFISKFKNPLGLPQLKLMFNEEELLVVKRGNRLSIIPVLENIAKRILLKIES
tara:strand:+ start:56 stop:520 length:465 start_codon:yes stop_codon:yes gene_type:complete